MRITNITAYAPKTNTGKATNNFSQQIQMQNLKYKYLGCDWVSFGSQNSKSIENLATKFENPIKMVVSDIDGTIVIDKVDGGKDILPSTHEAIQTLQTAGIPIILATGRSFSEAKSYLDSLGLNPDFTITEQGASVVNKQGERIHETTISLEDTKKVLELMKKWKKIDPQARLALYFNGEPYAEEVFTMHQDPKIKINHTKSFFNEFLNKGILPTKACLHKCDSRKTEDMKPVETFFKKNLNGNTTVFISSPYLCEVVNSSASKGEAIKFLLKDNPEIEIKNIAALGDAGNDIQMLQTVKAGGGAAIAMGNGIDELKEVANFITSHIEKDGFKEAIDAILRNNKRHEADIS